MIRLLMKSDKSLRRIKRLAGILDEESHKVALTRKKHGKFESQLIAKKLLTG